MANKTDTAGRKGFNPKAFAAAILIGLIAAGIYFYMAAGGAQRHASKDALAYIEGVWKRDFDVIFRYNVNSQRRKAIIMQRSEGDKEKEIKDLIAQEKASFEDASAGNDLRAQWVEKSIFVPGGSYKVTGVEMVKDMENPSQPSSERVNALVSIEADYPDGNTAPDLNGKIKSAEYQVLMVHSKNISRFLRDGVKDDRWLFHSISVKQDSVKYR